MQVETLYEFLDRDRLNKIQSLLSAGELDVNKQNRNGNTALHEAIIRRESLNLIKLLLQADANVKLINHDGHTALQLFMESNKHDRTKDYNNILNMFLNTGADVNSQSLKCEMTPLHYAARDSDLDSVKYLLSQGADPRARSTNGRTPLHYAVRFYSGDTAVIETLLSADGELLKIVDDYGQTPVHTLADVDFLNGKLDDIIKCLKLFKNFNTDMHVKDRNGLRPVDLAIKAACFCHNLSALGAFLQLGLIEIDGSCDLYGNDLPEYSTILFAACDRNSLPLAKYLLKKGANVDAVNDNGMSILHYTVSQSDGNDEYLNFLEYLLKWRPKFESGDVNGSSITSEIHLLVNKNPESPILMSILRYMVKYPLLNFELPLHASEVVCSFFASFNEVDQEDMGRVGRYTSDCSREIEQMDRDELPFYDLTFWHFITYDKEYFISYFKNRNLVKFLKDIDIINRYPIYGPEIQEKIDKILKKLSIYQKSAEVLSISFPRRYNLGDLVLEKIVSYCKTKELLQLCQ